MSYDVLVGSTHSIAARELRPVKACIRSGEELFRRAMGMIGVKLIQRDHAQAHGDRKSWAGRRAQLTLPRLPVTLLSVAHGGRRNGCAQAFGEPRRLRKICVSSQ